MNRRVLSRLVIGAAMLLAAAAPARAQERVANEAELKAAFVYRIVLFAEWPAASLPAGAAFQICLQGSDPAWIAAFETLEGKKVQGRALAPLRRVARGDDLRSCQVLFVPEREHRKPVVTLPGLLTIGEADAFAEAGGVVGFLRQGAQLRFDINRDAAAQAQLRLPTELLKVARTVIEGGGAR
jgi:hypothetical protein